MSLSYDACEFSCACHDQVSSVEDVDLSVCETACAWQQALLSVKVVMHGSLPALLRAWLCMARCTSVRGAAASCDCCTETDHMTAYVDCKSVSTPDHHEPSSLKVVLQDVRLALVHLSLSTCTTRICMPAHSTLLLIA